MGEYADDAYERSFNDYEEHHRLVGNGTSQEEMFNAGFTDEYGGEYFPGKFVGNKSLKKKEKKMVDWGNKYDYGDAYGDDDVDSKFTMHEFTGKVKFITEKALLMAIEDMQIWLPLSQIEFDDDPIIGMELTVDIPEWLAKKNDLL